MIDEKRVRDTWLGQLEVTASLKHEQINHPPHYQANGIEVISVIEAFDLNFNLGNTIKYILRAGRKNDDILQDLKKAAWYLDNEISKYKNE